MRDNPRWGGIVEDLGTYRNLRRPLQLQDETRWSSTHSTSRIFFRNAFHRGSPCSERKCELSLIRESPASRSAYARSSHTNAASTSPRAACASATWQAIVVEYSSSSSCSADSDSAP